MTADVVSLIVMSRQEPMTCPVPVENVAARELSIRNEWTERATKKNNRIVAEGYAERQIADSLRLAGKVNTEL